MVVKSVLGIIDILGAVILLTGGLVLWPGNGFTVTIGAIFFLKGIWNLIMGISRNKGKRFKEMFEGILDLISAGLVILIYFGTHNGLFAIAGALVLVKGAWYLLEGLTE